MTTIQAEQAHLQNRAAAMRKADRIAQRTRQCLYFAVRFAVGQGMSVSEAARLAGISRETVYKVLREEK